MKVIFLDHDGVICLSNNWGSRVKKQKEFYYKKDIPQNITQIDISVRFDDLDKKAIKVLNRILEKTNAEIVITSDWRKYASVEELGIFYEIQGIIKKPISITEIFHFDKWNKLGILPDHNKFSWQQYLDLEQKRYFEIKKYIDEHNEIEKYVIIDDLFMGKTYTNSFNKKINKDWGFKNFIWTPYYNEGIKQSGIENKIKKLLL